MVVLGAALAIIDRRVLGRWILACVLLAGVAAGMLITVASPFRFGGTSYYMEGVILSGGSILALIGYAVALLTFLGFRHFGGKRG